MLNDCENCQKKDACAKRYFEGNQQNCIDKQRAYTSFDKFVAWLAKSKGFNQ